MQADISGLKTNVSGLKNDVSNLKADVSGLKTDMSSLKEGQKRHDKKLDLMTSRQFVTNGILEILQDVIEETRHEVDEIKKQQRPPKAD